MDTEKSTFRPVPTQPDWPDLEREILRWWQQSDAFAKLAQRNAEGRRWSFLDGPITANNPMGVHHAWGRTLKDAWQRYKAMQGYAQRWQNGFDCQGLWVEVEVEREIGFKSKRDIEAYGIDNFVRRCKERVLRFAALQTEQSIRLGMWMHWDDPATLRGLAAAVDSDEPVALETCEGRRTATAERFASQLGTSPWCGSYFTFSDENNYMIWHFLKECHERGWVYSGTDVMPWCARCGTGLSQHEIATEGYRELEHRSPTLRFPLRDRPGQSLLVWTTTPWTLAGNVAAAVGPDLAYVAVRHGEEILYLAEAALATALRGDFEVVERLRGADMVGWRYTGPMDELPVQAEAIEHHVVIPWTEVGEAEGTGIVHIAPGCGAEDFELGKEFALPAIAPLTEDGRYLDGYDWLSGRDAATVADEILDRLEEKGLLYRADLYKHRYPVCWRCGAELVFRLVDEWFISMGPVYDKPRQALTADEVAQSLRYQMMDVVDQIRWLPAFGQQREIDWLHHMRDWMISKKRYWGLALPIWRCASCDWFDVIGGREELATRATGGWDRFEGHSPHRPFIDEVEITCQRCGAVAHRIPDVGNPWLDAGIVPYSTMHYRSERDYWRRWFPADFITESFPGQFRNWFYSLLAMSTVIENAPPFRTVLGYASLLAENGEEMHKSWGNMIEFGEAAERLGADVMRWMFLGHRPDTNLLFGYGPGNETRRRFLIPLWNVYAFLVQYGNASPDWTVPEYTDASAGTREAGQPGPVADGMDEAVWRELDRWIVLRLQQTIAEVTERMDDYDSSRAAAALESLVEDLSTWYVRRSRRRFWDGERAALDTLYAVMVDLVRLLAPFIPFTAEAMYRNLVAGAGRGAPESVHHTRWPEAMDLSTDDRRLLADMALVVRLAALGRSARSSAEMKLRQPLARAIVVVRTPEEARTVQRLARHLAQELNVKALEVTVGDDALMEHSVRPVLAKLGAKYGPRLPAIRAALEAADSAAVGGAVAAGQTVELTIDDETVRLAPDEIEVTAAPRQGLAVSSEEGYHVAVDSRLSPELRAEGTARDLVRHIQQLRKDSGLDISDRIGLTVEAPETIAAALDAHRPYVMGETLALSLAYGVPDREAAGTVTVTIDGQAVRLGVTRLDRPAH